MRHISADMASATVGDIDARLDAIVAHERVSIPLAIESGSRAWGFPSPDSDYDCRFVYVRRRDAYLTPWPPRDVIETPLEGDLDVDGWDLAKALQLMLKGNAVIIEWLRSPITYRDDEDFRAAFLDLASEHTDRVAIARHYLNFGEQLVRRHLSNQNEVLLKKLFYVLRPAAALRWMRLHPAASLPPMHFPTLIAQSDVPTQLAAVIDHLLVEKAKTRELGTGPAPDEIMTFIEAEFAAARSTLAASNLQAKAASRTQATVFFQTWVDRLDAG